MAKRIKLSGDVGWEITAKKLKNQLPKNGKHTILEIDSFGGSVFEGNRLYNVIKDHLNEFPGSISVELGVVAASAASYFPLAVGPENISVRENTVFMIHKAWTIALGNSDEMQLQAKILDGFDRFIAKIYSSITGKSIDETLAEMGSEVWLMGGQAVIDAGFATSLLDVSESDEEDNEENNDILDKNEISAKIEEIKNNLKDIDKNEDLNKWAAKINDVPENKIESTPPKSDGNIKEEDINQMKFEEYLNSNPEHKAEFNNLVKDAVNADRERGKKILNLAGFKPSDEIMDAFMDGSSVGDFAEKELERVNRAKMKAGETDLGSLDAGNQTPKAKEVENKDKSLDKEVDNSVSAYLNKGNK